MMPPRDHVGDALAGGLVAGEPEQERARRLGLAQDAHGHFRDDPEQPLRAGHQPHQIVAAVVEVLAAQANHLAVDQHHLETEDVVGGEPVFQAVHPARVLGDVAADGAGDLARRIGRVVEPARRDRIGDGKVGHAGLRDDAAVGVVDVEDAVELAEAQDDAVSERQRAARERGPGAARHHLHAALVAQPEHPRDLRGGLRQDHRHRKLPVSAQTVALVRPERVLIGDHALAGDDLGERGDHRVATLENRAVGGRHVHRGLSVPRQRPGHAGGRPMTHNMAGRARFGNRLGDRSEAGAAPARPRGRQFAAAIRGGAAPSRA